MKDLFGNEIPEPKPGPEGYTASGYKRRPATKPKGYAANPGTGPEGETCGSCKHACRFSNGGARSWAKCELQQWRWTGGRGTDILLRSAACSRWEKP